MSEPSRLKKLLMRRVVPTLVLGLLWLLDLSWRYREIGRERFEKVRRPDRGVVGAFLHGRTFLLARFMSRPRNGRWIAMCSTSLDGDAMAAVEEGLGFVVVRGSSGHGGLLAITEMIKRSKASPELSSCLAVDGSRGPRGHVQGGVISLAQRTCGIVVPVTASARPAWIFRKAWDRTMLAWPFAKVAIAFGEPLEVPAKLNRAQHDALRVELEERLVALQAEADRAVGGGDSEPVRA